MTRPEGWAAIAHSMATVAGFLGMATEHGASVPDQLGVPFARIILSQIVFVDMSSHFPCLLLVVCLTAQS